MWKYAWHEIIRRKGRSAAAIGSDALATMIFSVMISLLQYSEHSQYKTLYNTGTHFIAFRPVCCNLPLLKDETHEGFWANGSRSALLPVHLIDTIKKFSSIRDASPLLMFRFADSADGSNLIVAGFNPENMISVAHTTYPADVISGRFIAPHDTNAVLLEESFACSHHMAVGATVKIAGTLFQIIGIINAGIRPAKADIYMSLNQAKRLISRRTWNPITDEMNVILVESKDAQSHTLAVQDVINVLGKDKVVSSYSCHTPAAEAMNINRRLLWLGVIFVAIFVAVHVIRNHYASIIERRREIGILQSMGWHTSRIARMVGYEFILHAVLGGILGLYIAVLIELSLPASKSSCHILCAVDSFGTMLIGFGMVLFITVVSAMSFAFCFARFRPVINLKMS